MTVLDTRTQKLVNEIERAARAAAVATGTCASGSQRQTKCQIPG
jgi:hypothetical protein